MSDNVKKQIRNLVTQIHDEGKDPLKVLVNSISNMQRDYMNTAIDECVDCEIKCKTKSLICGDLEKACIMVVSDYPIQQQLEHGDNFFPFEHTDNFNNLRELFENYVDLESVVWIDSVHCCPYCTVNEKVISRPPKSTETKECSVFVQRLFDLMRASGQLVGVITMGNIALNSFIPNSKINKVRGTMLEYSGTPVFPTYNPNCIMSDTERDENKREDFGNDISNALEWFISHDRNVAKLSL